MDITTLQIIWFFLIGILFAGYSVLDGFDLGAGILLPFLAKNKSEEQVIIRSIGPFWDGNEVWLLTGGGALFAAFPHVYATVFSGFYLALMIVIFSLIFRAVSIEFYVYQNSNNNFWKRAFMIGSFLPSLLFGVALGNVIYGIPLDKNMDFSGNFLTLLRPYPLIIGVLGLTAILFQGASYIFLKTEGKIQKRANSILHKLWHLYILMFLLSLINPLFLSSDLLNNYPAWILAVFFVIALLWSKNTIKKSKDGLTFVLSSLCFIFLWGMAGSVHFPNMVKASNNKDFSLTIYNASSSKLTLSIMLIIALIGMPLVIGYTIYVYRVFKGKVK